MKKYVGAIDQGTTSTRFILFDQQGEMVALCQKEHKQYFPKPGWVEHDAWEIRENTRAVVLKTLQDSGISADELAAIGITNQRETTVVWDRETGEPLYNALVWQDTRTQAICNDLANEHGGTDAFRQITGLPVSTYFSGTKIRWLLDNVEAVRQAVKKGTALFGTMDTWVLWNLSGGKDGGQHLTDVTNAGRTQLMNINTLAWDSHMLSLFGIPESMLPEIRPSSGMFAETPASGFLGVKVPVTAMLGDQHAAMVGQTAFGPGEVKNTYGTGCFMLLNTGEKPVLSENGLITTLAYQFEGQKPVYALEGSVAIAGALVQWLRDNLGMIHSSDEVEALARTVDDNGGVYFVPAFSGLFAPYWRSDARGVIAGLTRFVNKGHIARAVLEATAYQTREILDAMVRDSGAELSSLKVDGGMVKNQLLMQFQADVLQVPVVLPKISETTALGAAYAAGLAVGFWKDQQALKKNWQVSKTWSPTKNSDVYDRGYQMWLKAVERTFDWTD